MDGWIACMHWRYKGSPDGFINPWFPALGEEGEFGKQERLGWKEAADGRIVFSYNKQKGRMSEECVYLVQSAGIIGLGGAD